MIEKGTGTIIGVAYLKDSLPALQRGKHQLKRARDEGKTLGRPRIPEKVERAVQAALAKKNRPGVQTFKGIVIVTSTLLPGASIPLDGLNTICPGTFVNANQCRLL